MGLCLCKDKKSSSTVGDEDGGRVDDDGSRSSGQVSAILLF
jgi:hypothetical protein